jgi:hypothetical protein
MPKIRRLNARDQADRDARGYEPGANDGNIGPAYFTNPNKKQRGRRARTKRRGEAQSVVYTFLQFLLESWLGAAEKDKGTGESIWETCPFCNAQMVFHTLPHRSDKPDKYRCHRCRNWGDHTDAIIAWQDIPKIMTHDALEPFRQEYAKLCPDGLHFAAKVGDAVATGDVAGTRPAWRGPPDADTSVDGDAITVPIDARCDVTLTLGEIEGILWARGFCQLHDMTLDQLAGIIEQHTNGAGGEVSHGTLLHADRTGDSSHRL